MLVGFCGIAQDRAGLEIFMMLEILEMLKNP